MISIENQTGFYNHLNQKIMKKIFLISCLALLFAACDSPGSKKDEATSKTDTTDKSMMSTTLYTPTQGDVTFKDKQLMVYKGDKWVTTDQNQTVGNGMTVYTNGTVKNGELTDTLSEGEIVSHTGDLYDKAGNAIHDAWDAAKEGVNKAGEATKEGVNKAGNDAKDQINKAGEAAGKSLNTASEAANKAVKDTKEAMDKK